MQYYQDNKHVEALIVLKSQVRNPLWLHYTSLHYILLPVWLECT